MISAGQRWELLGRLVQTQSISDAAGKYAVAIREKVELYDDFTPDNDPYGEHDFGSFEHAGETIFWKIDYYDRTLTKGSEDPSDPQQTVRVLTIMLASEYRCTSQAFLSRKPNNRRLVMHTIMEPSRIKLEEPAKKPLRRRSAWAGT